MRLIVAVTVLVGLLAHAAPAPAGTLEEIRASGEIKLAYRPDTPPFSSNVDGGEPEGFTIDLCRIIAADIHRHLGLEKMKITWVPVTAETRIDAVASGDAHIECGATTITLSRQEQVDFSNLIYATGASLMRYSEVPIADVFDLHGRTVSVVAGTTTETVLRTTLDENKIDARVVVVKDHGEALGLLAESKIDAMAGDQATLLGLGFEARGENQLVITEDMLSFEPYALPVPRNDADFRLEVNRALSNLYIRGDVGRAWQEWFGRYNVKPTRMLLMLYRLNSFAE